MQKRTALSLAATLGLTAVLVLVTGRPAAAQNREHQQLSAELRIMQEQQQQLTLAIAQLAEALKALNGRLDEAAAATRKGFADQELSIRGVGTDLSAIRERTQETDTRIRTLADELDALRSTVATLPSLLAQAATPPPVEPVDPNAPPAPATAVTAPAPTAPPPSTAGLSPTRMLDSAKSDYFAGQWTLALSGFEALLRTFPRSESAGEAQFYIGETHFAQNKWLDAIGAYTLVLQNHRTSGTVPDAYFKRGRAYEALGQADSARASYEAVVKAYPDSDGARLAQQALDRLNRRQAAPAPAPAR